MAHTMNDDIIKWTDEKLRRKADQEAEMRSLAYQDNDPKDAERHHARMRSYLDELQSRHG